MGKKKGMRKSISGCIALWVKKNVLEKGMRKSISNFNIKVLTDEVVLHYG